MSNSVGMGETLPSQLALGLALRDEATFENFYPRETLVQVLAAARAPKASHLTFLHGASGSGKSHLLQALCHQTCDSVYLPLDALSTMPAADVLCDLEQSALVAIDGLEHVAGKADWQEALFHFLNRAFAVSCPLWIAARKPPAHLPLSLADLRSRLMGGLTFALPDSDDDEKAAIVRFRGARRGLDVPLPVARFLCSRDSRSLNDLLTTLDRLDRASMALQRPLTVPLVKRVMGY